jgi:hypothetical protein
MELAEIMTDARRIAEEAAQHHYAVATHEDAEINNGDSAVYQASQALLLAAIGAAYPELDAHRVYLVWVETMASVAHCAATVVRQVEDERWWNVFVTIKDDDEAERAEWIAQALKREPIRVASRYTGSRWTSAEVRATCEWLVSNGFAYVESYPAGTGVTRAYYWGRKAV